VHHPTRPIVAFVNRLHLAGLDIYHTSRLKLRAHELTTRSSSPLNTVKMAKKLFTMLENNPEVMNSLAQSLGLDDTLAFYDIYSLTDPDLLAFVPRPVYALLVIIPLTPTWDAARKAEDADKGEYEGKGEDEPVLWFAQTIGNACGSIGLVHSLLNGEAADHIQPGSVLDKIRQDALPKTIWERAKVLEDSDEFEQAHAEAAKLGDTAAPTPVSDQHAGQHFVAFVKGKDGHLWELEGGRRGPLDRGELKEDEDALSPAALEAGIGRLIRIESQTGGDLRFSAIALAKSFN
jgi:ubiquitin carboxyl-terminal hydrolase L3